MHRLSFRPVGNDCLGRLPLCLAIIVLAFVPPSVGAGHSTTTHRHPLLSDNSHEEMLLYMAGATLCNQIGGDLDTASVCEQEATTCYGVCLYGGTIDEVEAACELVRMRKGIVDQENDLGQIISDFTAGNYPEAPKGGIHSPLPDNPPGMEKRCRERFMEKGDYCTAECSRYEPKYLWDEPCLEMKGNIRKLSVPADDDFGHYFYTVAWIDQTNAHIHHARSSQWSMNYYDSRHKHESIVRCDGSGSTANQHRAMVRDISFLVPGQYHGGIGGILREKTIGGGVTVHIHDISQGGMIIYDAKIDSLGCSEVECEWYAFGPSNSDLLVVAKEGAICGIFVKLQSKALQAGPLDFFSQDCSNSHNVCTDRDCERLPANCVYACCQNSGTDCLPSTVNGPSMDSNFCYYHGTKWGPCDHNPGSCPPIP